MSQNEGKKQGEPHKEPTLKKSLLTRKKFILIVDDSTEIRKMIRIMLRKEPCNVLEAGNATECMEQLSLHPVDLCLLDVEMPHMDGITLASMIKNQISYADVPLIMVTARSDQHSVIRALKAGAEDYVVKPVDKEVLLQKIHKYLNTKKS